MRATVTIRGDEEAVKELLDIIYYVREGQKVRGHEIDTEEIAEG